jgi:hypothetical protein
MSYIDTRAQGNGNSEENGIVIAKTIHHFNNMVLENSKKAYNFLEIYSLNKGLKEFGEKGYDTAFDEIKQLHQRTVFKPIILTDLTT